MFTINPMPAQVDPKLIAELAQVEPATVGHFRSHGFMNPELRAVIPDRRVAGTAVTVRSPGFDGFLVTYSLSLVRPGDFLVVSRCGDRNHAGLGGMLAYVAKTVGLAGIVVDGYACDFGEIRAYGVPVWCLGPAANVHKSMGTGGTINDVIDCGGVTVRPGDAIVADESGILVLDPSEIPDICAHALPAQKNEAVMRARLDAGEKWGEVSGTQKRLDDYMAKQGK
jgi:regulator of RNase E activity RraA